MSPIFLSGLASPALGGGAGGLRPLVGVPEVLPPPALLVPDVEPLGARPLCSQGLAGYDRIAV